MFKLNSALEAISLLDTFQSVLERIAYKMNSLPKYLFINPPVTTLDELKDADLRVTSLLESIVKQNSLTGFSEQDLREIEQNYPQLDLIKDVLEPYIATNRMLASEECADNIQYCLLGVPNHPGLDKQEAWEARAKITRSLATAKEALAQKVAKQNARVQELNSYPDIPHTRFIKEFEKFYFEVPDVPYESVDELFENCQTTQRVPFVNFKSFYKVHLGFTPDPRWLVQKNALPDDLIQLWVNNEKEALLREIKDPFKKFNDALLTLTDRTIKVTVNMKVDKRHDTRQALIRTLLEILNYQVDIPTLQVRDLTSIGYVYYPNETLDATVWSDLCMNNTFFNSIFAVDESIRLSKIKKNLFIRYLLGRESVSLRYNIGQKGDLPEGILDKQKYIRARITNTTDDEVTSLIDILSRVISAYKVHYEAVVRKYKQYIKTFTPEPLLQPGAKQVKEGTLKSMAPELFVSNYSRVCTSPPRIVDDEEAKVQRDLGRSVMRFPLYGEGGLDPLNFICPSDKMPFPGLRSNDLVNKDTFDVLPCCYKKDQRVKPDTKYNNYLRGEKMVKREQTKDVTVTKKILKFDAQGALPKNIVELLKLSVPPMQSFVRRGVSRSPLSAIECVHVALNPFATKAQVQELTKQTFAKLQTLEYATAARQELYNFKSDEILTLMQTKDFRSSWYLNSLEAFFSKHDITIYIFSDAEDGSLIVPPHFMTYYKLQPRSNVILIYEHYGSDTDNVKYPQSELIIRTSEGYRPTYMYSKMDPTVNLVFQAFYSLTEKFKFSYQIMPLTVTPLPIQSQRLDSYGKCRLINCDPVSIVVEPLPPYALPETNDMRRVRLDVALEFIRQYDIPLVEQRRSSTHLKELVIYLGTCKGSILIKDDLYKALPNLVTTDEVYDIFEEDYEEEYTPLEIFSQQQKFADVLTHNFLYAASVYFSTHEFTKDNLRAFVSQNVTIDKNMTYLSGPKFTSPENISLNPAPQMLNIVLPNLEVVKRLVYYLQLYATKHPDKLAEYKDKVFIPGYYKTPSDFTQHSKEYLLANAKSVHDYMQQDKLAKSRHVVPYVEPDKVQPYFFKNNLLGDRLYLAQNVTCYEHANYVMYYWRFMNRNPGDPSQDQAQDEYIDSNANDELDLDLDLDQDLDLDLGFDLSSRGGAKVSSKGSSKGSSSASSKVSSKVDNKVSSKVSSKVDNKVDNKVNDLEDIPYISFEVYKYVNENDIELIRGDGVRQDKVLAYKVNDEVRYTVLLIE